MRFCSLISITLSGSTSACPIPRSIRRILLLDRLGTLTPIDVPGAVLTAAIGINARGQIVGNYTGPSGAFHGFIVGRGVSTTVDVPGATLTNALGINAVGDVVGAYRDAAGAFHGFFVRP